mgnify:CR=1 FL=1
MRLFATGLVLAALVLSVPGIEDVARAWAPSWNPTFTIMVASVLIMGATTILYTYLGGMTAVIWTDVIQAALMCASAVVAIGTLLHRIGGGSLRLHPWRSRRRDLGRRRASARQRIAGPP